MLLFFFLPPNKIIPVSLSLLSICTCCFRSLRYDTMRFKAPSQIPTCFPSTVNKLRDQLCQRLTTNLLKPEHCHYPCQ